MSDWKPRMEKAVRHLAEGLAGIRAGTLSVGFIETFRASIRGNSVAIGRMGSVTGRGDRIVITPFDPRTVCVGIPPVSGEQRAELARHVKKLGEEAKVAVRAIRQDARKQIVARGRGSERAVQEATDAAVEEIERLVGSKTKELGT